jgi:hypothetical protein
MEKNTKTKQVEIFFLSHGGKEYPMGTLTLSEEMHSDIAFGIEVLFEGEFTDEARFSFIQVMTILEQGAEDPEMDAVEMGEVVRQMAAMVAASGGTVTDREGVRWMERLTNRVLRAEIPGGSEPFWKRAGLPAGTCKGYGGK